MTIHIREANTKETSYTPPALKILYPNPDCAEMNSPINEPSNENDTFNFNELNTHNNDEGITSLKNTSFLFAPIVSNKYSYL